MISQKYTAGKVEVYAFSYEEAFFLINAERIKMVMAWVDSIDITREDGRTATVYTTGIYQRNDNQ